MLSQFKLATLASVLLLGACGGGSGGESSSSNNIVAADTMLFDGSNTAYAYKLGFEEKDTIKTVLTRKDDLLFLNSNQLTQSIGSVLLTEKGVYQPESAINALSNQGIKDSFIKSIKNNEWILTPYNNQGLKSLEVLQKFTTLDLTGKVIAPTVNPSDAALIDYYRITNPEFYGQIKNSLLVKLATERAVFPEGAKCLQPFSTNYNEDALDFQPNDAANVINNAQSIQGWADLAFNFGISGSNLTEKRNWSGYNWGKLALKNYDASGNIPYIFAVEYLGKVYQAEFKTGTVTFQQQLADFRQRQLENGVDSMLVDEAVTNFDSSCSVFNAVAAQAIDKAIEKAKNSAPSLPPVNSLPPNTNLPISEIISSTPNSPSTPNCVGGLSFC